MSKLIKLGSVARQKNIQFIRKINEIGTVGQDEKLSSNADFVPYEVF